jgi:hypothetical protein
MIPWDERTSEEKALLVPSFSSLILWQAANGYYIESSNGLPFEITFLILPMVLNRHTREALPKKVSTSFAVWLNDNPIARACVVDRTPLIIQFTKEALIFGGTYGLLNVTINEVKANPNWKGRVNANLKLTGKEVQECAKRAEFVGKWFAKTGSSQTIMSLMGIKP